MKATLWFWRSGTKTRKNILEEKLRLLPLIFSKPKAKLFGRQKKWKNMVFKLFNLSLKKNNYGHQKQSNSSSIYFLGEGREISCCTALQYWLSRWQLPSSCRTC